MTEETLNKIKSRGYWRINFRPLVIGQKLELPQCKNVVERNAVNFRGWDYPHFPQRRGDDTDLVAGNEYYEGWIDWGAHKEIWRMYQSGQFIHYKAVEEDWFKEDGWYGGTQFQKIEPGTILAILNTVYLITEIFEFLSRIAKTGLFYKEGVMLDIGLIRTAKRQLVMMDPMRGHLFDKYVARIDAIPFSHQYSSDEIIQNAREEALKAIVHIFQRFGWDNPPVETFKNDQEKLVRRQL
ncbi:MAG: hypothetical protein ABSG75_12670 [Syntrophales bacterium]|jgi:hypothetical protein